MKAVILAGGLGTRLAEETGTRPKPMVEIGGRPMLWHIMKLYSAHGIHEFVVCLGYKGHVVKEYFASYFLRHCDVTIDLRANSIEVHEAKAEPWKVTLVDTGEETQTGGRLKRVLRYVRGDDAFCCTYGDGLADIDIGALVAFHRRHGRLATVTATQAPGRYGVIRAEGERVTGFEEKPHGKNGWINGGFFVLSPEVDGCIEGDATVLEREPLERLAAAGELRAYFHKGFWQSMDTFRERQQLEALWESGKAPWRNW